MHQATQDKIYEQLRAGVIEPSSIDWARPVVFATKNDVKIRFFV